MAEARAVWDRLLAHRRNTPLALEKNHASTKYGTCTYYVSIEGFEVRDHRTCTTTLSRGASYGTTLGCLSSAFYFDSVRLFQFMCFSILYMSRVVQRKRWSGCYTQIFPLEQGNIYFSFFREHYRTIPSPII